MPTLYDELAGADALVVGAGFAGATIARELAERGDMRVSVIERRSHLGGNAYDHYDDHGVLIHIYGPHIFHTDSERVFDYLSRFTEWNGYSHKVQANIDGDLVPVPFNLNSIAACFESGQAADISAALLANYPIGTRIGILDLLEHPNRQLQELARFVYEKVYLQYTMKQWGLRPEEIDPAVTARVPVLVDSDDRYFQDIYQGLPLDGYHRLFDRLLDHPNISVRQGIDSIGVLRLQISEPEGDDGQRSVHQIGVFDRPFSGPIIYTGAIDELVTWCYGVLPYRSLDFTYQTHSQQHVQPIGTINYTTGEEFTRTTEYSWLTGQQIGLTTIATEFPKAFQSPKLQIPYYPIITEQNQAAYQRYLDMFRDVPQLIFLGRLAEFRYYDMDDIVERALVLADELLA